MRACWPAYGFDAIGEREMGMCRRGLLALGLALLTGFAHAQDGASPEWIAWTKRLRDVDLNREIEQTIYESVSKGDVTALKAFAHTVYRQENHLMAPLAPTLKDVWTYLNEDTSKPDMAHDRGRTSDLGAKVALSLDSCGNAGLQLRGLLGLIIADSAKPVIRNGRAMFDGTSLDTDYSESMSRCELVSRRISASSQAERLVGDRCSSTGVGCMDDPDFSSESDQENPLSP